MSLRKVSRTKSLSLNDEFPLKGPPPRARTSLKKTEDTAKIIKLIDDNLIGKGVAFLGPFGRRKVVYADYVSSGRSLQFLEDYIIKEVLPAFGDINCKSSVTGLQSQLYFNEAKAIIQGATNASSDDEIFFCDGHTKHPAEYLIQIVLNDCRFEKQPVLFVSSFEPAENLKLWIDARFQIERVFKTKDGYLDLVDLEKKLVSHSETGKILVGLFSAVSRISGVLADDVATTILLHQYGATSIWDYCHAAPNSIVDVNPTLPGAVKDAVIYNANKFIGGLQAPRVLIIKKNLLNNTNGNVIIDTSSVVGAVRAGLVMQLKESVGLNSITARQDKICKQILSHIRTIPEILLLGPAGTTAKRVPIICFLVRHSRGAFLHHRFIVAILNDVFGIQATVVNHLGDALGISGKLCVEYEQVLDDDTRKAESLRTGFTKLYLPFFMSESEIGFIMEALKMVATEAWKLLPQYVIDENTGDWRHHSNSLAKERKNLGAIRYTDGRMLFSDRRISGPGIFPQNYAECLQTARNIFNRARKIAQKSIISVNLPLKLSKEKLEHLRWYMLPGEAHKLLLGHSQHVKQTVPFDPNKTTMTPSLFTIYRHNSLSALEVKRFKSRSVPASPHELTDKLENTHKIQTPLIRFSLGGEVTTLMSLCPQRVSALMGKTVGRKERNRCYSVGATENNGSLVYDDILNDIPQTVKERSCSCSSQTENSFGSDTLDHNTNSLNCTINLHNHDYSQSASFSSECTEDIQAYVKEVTQELATEIKSEIREVISKVEDVLETSDLLDSTLNLTFCQSSSSNDSVSATDVAEYLKECTKEITSDIQSEIREMVNAVDDFISPDNQHDGSTKNDLVIKERRNPVESKILNKQRYSDITDSRPNISEIALKQRSESYPRPNSSPGWQASTSANCPENSTPSCPYTGAISKLVDSKSTTSQDSGINMCFQDSEDTKSKTKDNKYPNIYERNSSVSSSSSSKTANDDDNVDDKSTSIDDSTISSSSPAPQRNSTRKITIGDTESDSESIKWHNLPKEIWKPSAEAMDEYDMLKDGDKILVCLSGSSASLCLLHVLRQFSRARQIHIDLGAITIGTSGVDPRALMLYMRDLGVTFVLDQQGPNETLRTKLSSVAKRRGYNVLAMGETLDKLADDFLLSILYKGKLHATQAHCIRDGDLRVIRPFIFIRERLLEDFSLQNSFPVRPSKIVNRPLNATNSILKVQELINPNVYDNIKNALKPLLSTQIEATKTSYDLLMYQLKSRD